jgi:hypothetical protein
MQKIILSIVFVFTLCSFVQYSRVSGFDMSLCSTAHNGEVQSGDLLHNGSIVGSVIGINRSSKTIKAKYFAFKENGKTVNERYNEWRKNNKNIVLVSSGAYSTDFSAGGSPVGLTVDNGNEVNINYNDKMDGLVIIEEAGGVRVTNIEDGNLRIENGGSWETVDIKNDLQRRKFLKWAKEKQATVFQTHLLLYDNKMKVAYNANKSVSVRKLLVLAEDNAKNIFHYVIYTKKEGYNLTDLANNTLAMFNGKGYKVIGAMNLDTGSLDILSTSESYSDCNGTYITGTQNSERPKMTNLLAYYY